VKHKASKRRRAVVIRSYNHGRAEDSNDDATQLTTATPPSTSTATTTVVTDAADKETENSCQVCLLAPRGGITLVLCRHARFCEAVQTGRLLKVVTYLPCLPYDHYNGDARLSVAERVSLTEYCILIYERFSGIVVTYCNFSPLYVCIEVAKSQIPLRYLVPTSFEPAPNQLRIN